MLWSLFSEFFALSSRALVSRVGGARGIVTPAQITVLKLETAAPIGLEANTRASGPNFCLRSYRNTGHAAHLFGDALRRNRASTKIVACVES